MKVPLVDLKIQYERIKDEVQEAWDEIFSNTSYVLGPAVSAFEEEFARYCGVEHCIGVANGGDALELCLRALDIGVGDEVIIPANTFAATAMAVLQAGATPVAVDVDEAYHLIDPDHIAEAIGPRTRAIIPVHLFGQLAPMEPILAIAAEHGLKVIEDAAQCQGATQNGMHAGQFGDMTATSFYPGKNLGAFGDGGAVLTQDPRLAERVRRLRNYGGISKYEHAESGRNSRLDTLQAAVLRVKLRHLDTWNKERTFAASAYQDALSQCPGIELPQVSPKNDHVWHLFVVKIENRDRVLDALHQSNIGAGIHYPQTVNSIPSVTALDTVRAERMAPRILSIPIFPGISSGQIDHVSQTLARCCQ
jgi:dTDP-4-amino-4,6-dideoxygalactose transaminase